MILIADSGSTKTTWCVSIANSLSFEIHTPGINPVRDDEATIREVVRSAREAIDAECLMGRASSFAPATGFDAVHFYGAGCLPTFIAPLEKALKEYFPTARLSIDSDLLGAARALCGHREGIACILGTGSNSCYYDGVRIVENVSPLGWILGDEGSGAVLGRQLVGDVLKGQLPPEVCAAFLHRFSFTRASIIESVYRQPQPNRFLASLVPFLREHAAVPDVHAFLVREFRRFFVRNVAAYGRLDLPVHFVGGVAAHFSKELSEASEMEGFKVGRIIASPISDLLRFHE